MTIIENTTTSPRNGKSGHGDDMVPAFADQVLMSGAGLASQGLTGARRVVDGAIGAVDTLVLGTLDIVEQLVDARILTELASKSISVARQSWSAGIETSREALAAI